MNRFINSDEHVLPRPVEKLPDYAHAKSRRSLAEKLLLSFGQSDAAATAIADAVVDPTIVRKNIGETTDPQVEEIPVPGGIMLGIRTHVWVRRVFPDPRNPRIGPARRHPFATDPGQGEEDSRFRPVPEPKSPKGASADAPELEVEVESRPHLEWAASQAAKYILADNDWRSSIASQGVMEAVWLVPTTYRHDDGSDTVTILTTVEGSSRTSAVHDLLAIRSADLPYDDYDSRLRLHYRKLNDSMERGPSSEQLVALRCERIPALILVGFRRNSPGTAGFPTAVKSLVALRHVDPPKPWGDGPENESLADEVLDELYRRNLISDTERAYYAGSCTKAEAKAAHLSDDPINRAARIVALFTSDDDRKSDAIRVAVTSQSTRKRISPKLCNELATALIVRSLSEDPLKADQIRRYMRHAFGGAAHREKWASTDRDVDSLTKEALREVNQAILSDTQGEAGPASLELAVKAAYPLIVKGALNADRGTANNLQPDRRSPGEVLDTMRRRIHGVHQLAQAIRDYSAGIPIRAVDEAGNTLDREDGSGYETVTDIYLREEFPPAGKYLGRSSGSTPTELLRNRLGEFSDAMDKLEVAFEAIASVKGVNGTTLVERDGVRVDSCDEWRRILGQIGDELSFWGRQYKQRHRNGVAATVPVEPSEQDQNEEPFDDEWEESESNLDTATA